jgi:hypothetical protein
MKRIFLLLATGMLPIIAAHAQDKQTQASVTKAEIDQKLVSIRNPLPVDDKNLVRPKALHDFDKTFKTSAVDWYVIKKGFMARFTKEDIQHRIIYTSKGNRFATFRYYNEGQLNPGVRNLVKTVWHDATINNITEVNFAGKTAYLVNIEDKTSIKIIKVVNDDMEVYHEIFK